MQAQLLFASRKKEKKATMHLWETACSNWINHCTTFHALFIICLNATRSTTEMYAFSKGYRRKQLMQCDSTAVKKCFVSERFFSVNYNLNSQRHVNEQSKTSASTASISKYLYPSHSCKCGCMQTRLCNDKIKYISLYMLKKSQTLLPWIAFCGTELD